MDPLLSSRRAILTALKADAGIVALMPATSVYGQSTPANVAWPFIRYGAPSDVPLRATCVDGSTVTVGINGFAKPRFDGGGAVVETAEDHCHRIAGAIRDALHGRKLPLEEGGFAAITFTSRQIAQDGAEADAYQCAVNLAVRCVRE